MDVNKFVEGEEEGMEEGIGEMKQGRARGREEQKERWRERGRKGKRERWRKGWDSYLRSAPAVVSFMSLRQLRPAMVLASSSALR